MAAGARFGWRGLVRVWSSAASAGRNRRPTDAIMLALVVVALAVVAWPSDQPGSAPGNLDLGIASFFAALPDFAGLLWSLAYTALTLWGLVLLALPLVFHGRRSLSAALALAALVALAGGLVLGSRAGYPGSDLWASFVDVPDAAISPAVRVAVLGAIVMTASPYVSRPLRYVGRILVAVGAVAAVGMQISWASGVVIGLLLAVAGAATTHLLLGTPSGLLTAEQVEIALADLDIDAVDATALSDDGSGAALWSVSTQNLGALRVKVLGRDAWDTQFVGSLWTALTRRGERPRLGRSREFRVEHEALATLMADRAGVPVLPVTVVGHSGQGDALLVTAAPSWTLTGETGESGKTGETAMTDAEIDDAWRALLALHGARIAHGRMGSGAVVRRADGRIAFTDFADADLTADFGDQQVDRVGLLAATAVHVGRERALARAGSILGTSGLVDLLPYLQPAVLNRADRTAIRSLDWSMKDLQHDAVTLADVPAPPLQQVRRVSAKSIAIVAIVALMAYTLVGVFSGVDLASVTQALESASWAWIVFALLCSPLIQAFLAFSTLGATVKRLRYVPVLMLQYAIGFIALALPSTAARLALQVRFFERYGLPPATSIGIGMIDGFSGFIVQVTLIALILLSGLPGFTSSIRGAGSSSTTTDTAGGPPIIVLVVAFTLIALAVTIATPTLRRRLLGSVPRLRSKVAEQRRQAGDALAVVRVPRKVGTMLLGNLGAQVMQALILGLCLAAFGESAHLSQLIIINTAVSLFAGLMPVPGGMGVAEAGYTAGLQAVGIPPAVAVSAAIVFRLVTFYLPPLWGSVAMRWLRRHSYI